MSGQDTVSAVPAQPYTFGGFPHDWRESDIVIVPVAYDRTASFQAGSAFGPLQVIGVSPQLEFYDAETKLTLADEAAIGTMPQVLPTNDHALMMKRIERVVGGLLTLEKFPLMLGGEHSLTYGAVQACKKFFDEPFSVLQLDAHSDFYPGYEESKWSHASVARRIAELGLPLTLAGVRSTNAALEADTMLRRNVTTFYAHDERFSASYPPEEIARDIARSLPQGKVYITLDVDVLEPSAIGYSTGTPEPDGLSYRQVRAILKEVARTRTIIAADVVEFAPKANDYGPAFFVARLMYQLLTYRHYYGKKKTA